jgi:dolichyl-diphosphooligosaccharide--protein glycosyltransferase
MREWQRQPSYCFVNGEPVLGALDGYYYLRLARDLYEGNYDEIDTLRHSPKFERERPMPPPLLPVLAAGMARLTPYSMNWIGLLLPPVLGVLIVIPMYGIGRHFGGRITGLTAAFFAIIAPYYVYRSAMGWFDTDCMNVTWVLATAWCFLEFGLRRTRQRYVWLASGFICTWLFILWWDQTREAALVLSILPLLIVALFMYRPSKKNKYIVLGVVVLLLAVMVFVKWNSLHAFTNDSIQRLSARIKQVTQLAPGAFPAQKISTTEQVRPSFQYIVDAATRNSVFLVLAVFGFIWMVLSHLKKSVCLVSLAGLSALAIFYAERFVVFMIPLVALGQGFLVSRIWSLRSDEAAQKGFPLLYRFLHRKPEETVNTGTMKPRPRAILAGMGSGILVILFAVFPLSVLAKGLTSWPKHSAVQLSAMAQLAEITPPSAVIWAWWDKAHGINYWSRRKTIIDGARHGKAASVYNGVPLATDDERLAANFIQFYSRHGPMGFWYMQRGIGMNRAESLAFVKKLFSGGPAKAREILSGMELTPIANYRDVKSWMKFFFPPDAPPTYLYMDKDYLDLAYWWYWYGTWDPKKKKGIHPTYQPFMNLDYRGKVITGANGFRVDVENGMAVMGNKAAPLTAIVLRNEKMATESVYERPQGGRFEMATPGGFGVLMTPDIADSVFNRLFVRVDPTLEHFTPVLQHAPFYQVWEVQGDRWNE